MKSQIVYKVNATLEELPSVAKEILKQIGNNAILLLYGNLAAGKTTLVSTIVKELGEGVATSPTFALQQCYGDKIFHYDFYRVDFNEILSLGLLDEFEKEGLHLVEWADPKLKETLFSAGFKLFELNIQVNDGIREYILKVYNA